MNFDDISNQSIDIQHHGVKGQKWGVKKKPVTLERHKRGLIAKTAAKVSPKIRENQKKTGIYNLKDKNGKKVGDLQVYKESPKSMNIVWLGVNKKERGQGYASSAMQQAVDLARKQKMSQVTLEVPGDSPDAHHIYRKMGFKDNKKISSDDDIWGGLTSMTKKLDHSVRPEIIGDDILNKSINIQHHGVRGQKWGVRKRIQLASGQRRAKKQLAEDSKAREASWQKTYTNRSKMSDQELRRSVTRLQLENQLRQQVALANPQTKSAGRQAIEKFGGQILGQVATQVASNLASQAIRKMK